MKPRDWECDRPCRGLTRSNGVSEGRVCDLLSVFAGRWNLAPVGSVTDQEHLIFFKKGGGGSEICRK